MLPIWQSIIAVIVVHAVIYGVQRLVRREIPGIGRGGEEGIYLILMPVGFGLSGFDLPYWVVAPLVAGGLVRLLYSVRKLVVAKDGASRA